MNLTKPVSFLAVLLVSSVAQAASLVGADYHDRGEDPQTVANLFKANGFNHARIDIATSIPGEVTARMIQLVTTLANNGISTEAIIYTSGANAARNGVCPGDLPSIEAAAYNEAYQQVSSLRNLVRDFEMQNEVSLYPGIYPLGRYPSGPFESAYFYNTVCAHTMAAVLRGISLAVAQVGAEYGLHLRRTLGATSDGSSGFLLFMQQNNVAFDVVGLHVYPTVTQANL